MDIPGRPDRLVGTLVGESTSREFRLAVTHEAIREQDLIAVDVVVRRPDAADSPECLRIWAKVARIERINPLFPVEAGHELAATQTHALDTVLSLSREMVTAVCHVLGAEPIAGTSAGKLDQVRYPAKPATSAYRPESADIQRIVLGDLEQKQGRALDIARLSNRPDVDVQVDGHAIVTRHLAILAMTGAGKSWTARRIIEELAAKHYPIVIFDPHGDYTGLAEVPGLAGKVRRYHAQFPVFDLDADTVVAVIESLGRKLSDTQRDRFGPLFAAADRFMEGHRDELDERARWLSDYLGDAGIARFGLKRNLFLLADVIEAAVKSARGKDSVSQERLVEFAGGSQALKLSGNEPQWLQGMPGKIRAAAKQIHHMERISREVAGASDPLPLDHTQLVVYDRISVVALAGYQPNMQATLCSMVADSIFSARVDQSLALRVLMVFEEAHNFVPARAETEAETRSVTTIRKIAQEGRKFGVGLVLISQRPSRLDETTLSQCNSYIVMRMVNPADQSYVRRVIESLGEEDARMLPDLDVGEALISGQLTNFPVLVRIKEPESKGEREEEDAFVELENAHRQRSAP